MRMCMLSGCICIALRLPIDGDDPLDVVNRLNGRSKIGAKKKPICDWLQFRVCVPDHQRRWKWPAWEPFTCPSIASLTHTHTRIYWLAAFLINRIAHCNYLIILKFSRFSDGSFLSFVPCQTALNSLCRLSGGNGFILPYCLIHNYSYDPTIIGSH